MDESGRSNHERVSRVNAALQAAGLVTWFDEERMHGDVVAQMTDGIDHSSLVLVFITHNYINKVAGFGPNGANDNCKVRAAYTPSAAERCPSLAHPYSERDVGACATQAEFDYATHRKGVERVLPVLMEAGCRDSRQWQGAVGMRLAGQLYQDLSEDGEAFDAGVAELVERIGTDLRLNAWDTVSGRINGNDTARDRSLSRLATMSRKVTERIKDTRTKIKQSFGNLS